MRRRLRFDIWLSLLLALPIMLGIVWLFNHAVFPALYESYAASNAGEAGTVGAPAAGDTFRARTLDEMLEHGTFTFGGDLYAVLNNGGPFYKSRRWEALELEDGSRIAARINHDAIRDDGEPGLYSHDILLPVGTIVHGELPAELVEGFAPYGGLTRTDLMVDMEGGHAVYGYDTLNGYIVVPMQLVLLVGFALLFHRIGVKMGLFPPILPRRAREKTEAAE